jgi:Recombination endonuclease VII
VKTCKICNSYLSLSEFYRVKTGSQVGKYSSYCKPCDRQKASDYNKGRYTTEDNSIKHFLYRYGLTKEELDDMEFAQDYLCLYCDKDMLGKYDVDHDHKCCSGRVLCGGKCILGLCCRSCNRSVAILDNIPLLIKALKVRNMSWPL